MRRLPLAARRALVVAPHPDDETIGAWALMRKLKRAGVRVEVLVVTDGAASHPGSRLWPPHRLVSERRRETLRAMATLAIAPDRVRFLMLPDGALDRDAALARSLARAMRKRPPPDLIVGPAADDAHGDHRAVASALAAIRRRGEARLGYRVWPLRGAAGGRGVRVPLDGRAIVAKRRLVRSYRTQGGRIGDAEAGCTLTARHVNAFVRPAERFAWA